MLDIGLIERVVLDLAAKGGVENFLFDQCVDLELGADLISELLLSCFRRSRRRPVATIIAKV